LKIIKNLSDKELAHTAKQIALETQARANRKSAAREILAVLKKHNLTLKDLSDLNFATRSKNSKAAVGTKVQKDSKKTDNRAKVIAKFRNPTGSERWTGRGRAPKWVAEILTKQKITLAQFKQDKRYKI
jgi:DNA-binding protein H-NS